MLRHPLLAVLGVNALKLPGMTSSSSPSLDDSSLDELHPNTAFMTSLISFRASLCAAGMASSTTSAASSSIIPSHARRTARVSLHFPNSALAKGTARQFSSSKATDLAPRMNASSRCALRARSSGSYSRMTFISASLVAFAHIALATVATATRRSRSAFNAERCRSVLPPKFSALHAPPLLRKLSCSPSLRTASSCCSSRIARVAAATAARRNVRVVDAALTAASYASLVALARLISRVTASLWTMGSSLSSAWNVAATPGTSARVVAAALSASRLATTVSALSIAASNLPMASPSASMPAAVLDVLAVGSTCSAFNVALKLRRRLSRWASRSKMRSSSLSSASFVGA
mmetsp:Transcript_13816/g.54769  ORF Transcript_13816/g.54769 Transcript_13816/m.54769 type:complete len:348 (+) Transcript_13816:395-1438(+)